MPTCSGTPPPQKVQEGISCNCSAWAKQQDGIYCADMAKNAGISLQKLYDLNPALKGDCLGLWVGYAYCIGLSGRTTVAPSSTNKPTLSTSTRTHHTHT